MKENIELGSEELLELMRYAFLRLDGAWFMASTEKLGIEVATELDVQAWERFSERLGKKIASLTDLTVPFKVFRNLMNNYFYDLTFL